MVVICSDNVNKLWQLLLYNSIEKCNLFNAYKHMETLNAIIKQIPQRELFGILDMLFYKKKAFDNTKLPFISFLPG